MGLQFPKVNGLVFDFAHIEIDLGGKIYTAFENISYNQPLEEAGLFGTAAYPLGRTRGRLGMGEGELQWSALEEAQTFLDELGDGYLEKIFPVSCTFSAEGASPIKHVLYEVRLLDVADDHAGGSDPLGETMPFSFLRMTRNGKRALLSQPK
jgi:hypothetical protein